MKKLITFLFLLNIAFAQNSWVNITLLTDNYPVETSWCIVDINNDTIAASQDGMLENTIYEDTVDLPSGDYTIYLNDSYGDGLGASQWGGTDGSFVVENTCQGTLMEGYGDFGSQLVESLFIAPCAPPVFEPCQGVESVNAYQLCWDNQAAIVFEWWTSLENTGCDVVGLHFGAESGFNFTWEGLWLASNGYNNFAAPAGSGQMPPNWEEEHYMVLEFADESLSDTIFFTPESCIPGCTDSTAISYNPWATIDDGSCSGTACGSNEYQISMDITLDNWPGETSWIMNSAGVIGQAPQGTYSFNDIGQTYTYDFCVSSTAGFEIIVNDSYGDGMAGTTSGGSLDGEIVVYDCNQDTITYLSSGTWSNGATNVGVDFGGYPGGNVVYSTPQAGIECGGVDTIYGCTNPLYQEFNPIANMDDSTCLLPHVVGCVDSTMFNYDSTATIMDLVPVCDYTLVLQDDGGDGWGNSYLGISQGENYWTFTIGPNSYGQQFPIELNSNEPVVAYYFEVGGAQATPQELNFQTLHNSFYLINSLGDTLLGEGSNPFFDNGQGSLQAFKSPAWTTYQANPSCGSYCEPVTYGCIDSLAVNYDATKNTDDGSCYYNPGCTNSLYLEYDATYDYNDGSCSTLVVYGCMDSSALNYEPLANVEIPNSCIAVVEGCTDSEMFNYNINANVDDGSCESFIYGCTDVTAFNYNPLANTDDDSCVPVVLGCIEATAFNYNQLANTDDGSCIDVVFGCIDPTMFNYDSEANTDNGSCIDYVYGCTDSLAMNYDQMANTDNESCIYPIPGCTELSAINYNSEANVSDSSCYYSAGCAVGDIYYIPNECFSWVIDIDNYCCDSDWDETCAYLYQYCLDGWSGPTDIQNLRETLLNSYPNPTDGIVYFTDYVDVIVYDIKGSVISRNIHVDFVYLPDNNGLYNMVIKYKGMTISHKVLRNGAQ